MSEQHLKDFAETAERRVPVPDLADLTSRGRDLRRIRMAAVAGALALVVTIGGVFSSVTRDDRSTVPAEDPVPTPAFEELSARPAEHPRLVPGKQYAVRPWNLDGYGVSARFIAPARGWVWRGDGALKMPSGTYGDLPRRPYAGVAVMTADRVPVRQCSEVNPPRQDLAEDPLAAARQIAEIPGTRAIGSARATELSGWPAAYVRLEVPKLCPKWNDVILWGVTKAMFGGQPGIATVIYPGQVLEVWVVDVDGAWVIVYSELSPGLPEGIRAETRVLLDSVELEKVEE
ncbi:MAG: hypothetical protein ABWX84_04160 [Nocardioides sp.]